MAENDFQPRDNDHLVEPMFAGLGVGEEEAEEGESAAEPPRARRGLLATLLEWVRRLLPGA